MIDTPFLLVKIPPHPVSLFFFLHPGFKYDHWQHQDKALDPRWRYPCDLWARTRDEHRLRKETQRVSTLRAGNVGVPEMGDTRNLW